MYQIKLNGNLVYDPRVPDYAVLEAKLQQELNTAGTLTVSAYPDHPCYSAKRMTDIITVLQDRVVIFRGRILDDEYGFYRNRKLKCEGQLAFFNDSRVRPYKYEGSVEGYFAMLVEQHNAQVDAARQFKVGTVTVTDSNDYIVRASSDYPKTITEIKDKLISSLGGYIFERVEDDGVYLDYLSDTNVKNVQDVEFGVNLLDLSQMTKGGDIATAIIPLGAEQEDGSRITIASVNNGLDYVTDETAVEKYGMICKVVEHDDVTLPENLLSKGMEDLAEAMHPSETINATAADLSAAGYDIQSFRFGRYVRVISVPHGLTEYMLVSKLTTDLLNAANNRLTLGVTRKTYTERQNQINGEQGKNAANLEGLFRRTETIAKNARSLIMLLDNEYQGIPTDHEGNYTAFPECRTSVQVFYGSADVSADCTYAVEKSGVTGVWDGATRTYTVTALDADEGYVTITASYLGLATAKRFNIAKVRDGTPGKQGLQGADGKGIESTTVTYQAGASQTTAPTGTWSVSVPKLSKSLPYLWTRTVITYTDNTTSTSYSVSSTLDGIEIGGRNLLTTTKDLSGWFKSSNVTVSVDDDGMTVATFADVPTLGWNHIRCQPNILYSKVKNQTVTVSFWGRANDTDTSSGYANIRLSLSLAKSSTGERTLYKDTNYSGTLTTEWKRYSITANITDSYFTSGSGTASDCDYVRVAFYRYNLKGAQIKWCKLEIGNKATDWTPAPEDVDNAINEQGEALTEEIQRSYTEAVSTSESIMSEAVKEYVKSTEFSEYKEETESKFNQQADEVAIQISQAKTEVDDKYGDAKTFFEQMAMFYNFTLDGFVIGKSDSPFAQRQTDSVWELLMNGLAVMRADAAKGTFTAPSLTVSKMLNVLGLVVEKDEETGIVNCYYGGEG